MESDAFGTMDHSLENSCPHMGALLKEENGTLKCPWHGLKFNCSDKKLINDHQEPKPILHTIIQNKSNFPIFCVWENAKDLEHVSTLHSKTNNQFELLFVDKNEEHGYETMIFRTIRKFFFISIFSFGFRKIIKTNQIYQVELIPLLRMRIVLNSNLKESENNTTLMVDEVLIFAPTFFSLFKRPIEKYLKRHTHIQCQEDEPFRERRKWLKEKGVDLPYQVLRQGFLKSIERLFQVH